MIFRVEDAVEIASRHLRRALVSGAALRELRAAARSVPRVAHAVGFECRLREDAARVDLGLTIDPENDGPRVLAGFRPSGGSARARRSWARIAKFCSLWQQPRTRLRPIARLFVELDAPSGLDARLAPSVFAQLAPAPDLDGPRMDRVPAALDAAIRLWRGRGTADASARRLQRVLAALPHDAEVLAIGAMLGRAGSPLRLSIRLARRNAAVALAALGWKEHHRGVARALAAIPRQPTVAFDLDLEAEAAPIGIQLSADRVRGRTRSWTELLDRLVARGWCARDKRDALLAWPGMGRERMPGFGWPCAFERYLSNLKLAAWPDGTIEAKAYLAAVPRFTLIDRP